MKKKQNVLLFLLQYDLQHLVLLLQRLNLARLLFTLFCERVGTLLEVVDEPLLPLPEPPLRLPVLLLSALDAVPRQGGVLLGFIQGVRTLYYLLTSGAVTSCFLLFRAKQNK